MKRKFQFIQGDQYNVVTLRSELILLIVCLVLLGLAIWFANTPIATRNSFEYTLVIYAKFASILIPIGVMVLPTMGLISIAHHRRRYGPNWRPILAKQLEEMGWSKGPNRVS
ncbi:hypothetical protein KKI23_03525 [Patescibacteria group bacterium]|nr:hypothetical protein [Patescibacteria group bacterium]